MKVQDTLVIEIEAFPSLPPGNFPMTTISSYKTMMLDKASNMCGSREVTSAILRAFPRKVGRQLQEVWDWRNTVAAGAIPVKVAYNSGENPAAMPQ